MLSVLLVIGVVILAFSIPSRWFGLLGAKLTGVPKELVSDAIGETNSCIVSFDDEKITHLRRSNGYTETVQWRELAEIYIRITDTGPNEDDAYFMFVKADGTGCSILTSTEGAVDVLNKATALHWFSDRELRAGLEAIKHRQLGTRKFLLWASQRDGVAIPAVFPDVRPDDSLHFDDESITISGVSRQGATLPWRSLQTVKAVLGPRGYSFTLSGAGQSLVAPVTTNGLAEFVGKIHSLPGFSEAASEAMANAVRACNLSQTEFTLYRAG